MHKQKMNKHMQSYDRWTAVFSVLRNVESRARSSSVSLLHQLITVCRALSRRHLLLFTYWGLLTCNGYNLQEFNFSSSLSIRDDKQGETLEAEAKFKEAEQNIIFHSESICCKTLRNI